MFNKIKNGKKLLEPWTNIHISPFYKNKGDRRKLSNHWHIFITPIKIFEKVILHRLKENLHISEFQSGGQSGHSVIENLLYTNHL